MDDVELQKELLHLPVEIGGYSVSALHAEWRLDEAKHALQDREAMLVLDGSINGKNDKERAAQLWNATLSMRDGVLSAERDYKLARITLEQCQNRFSALKAIARLRARSLEE